MLSLYTSALQEWAKGYKCLGFFFSSMPTHLCSCLSSVSVFTHTFISTEGKIMTIYLPGSASEQSCRANSELRFTVFVAKSAWDLSWAAGWRLHFHIRAPCLSLKYFDSQFPDQMCSGSVLPWALRTCVQGSQTFWNKSECCGRPAAPAWDLDKEAALLKEAWGSLAWSFCNSTSLQGWIGRPEALNEPLSPAMPNSEMSSSLPASWEARD